MNPLQLAKMMFEMKMGQMKQARHNPRLQLRQQQQQQKQEQNTTASLLCLTKVSQHKHAR